MAALRMRVDAQLATQSDWQPTLRRTMDVLLAATAATAATPLPPPTWWAPHAVQTLGTLAATSAGVWVGAWLVTRRETAVRKEKRTADALFLAVTVSGRLEQFVSVCSDVAADDGLRRGERDVHGNLRIQVKAPLLNYADLDVEWKSLPGHLLDKVHSIPRRLATLTEYLAWASEESYEDLFFADRQRKFAELGLHAAAVSEELRASVGLPPKIDPNSKTVNYLNETHENLQRAEAERQARQDKIMDDLSFLNQGSDS